MAWESLGLSVKAGLAYPGKGGFLAVGLGGVMGVMGLTKKAGTIIITGFPGAGKTTLVNRVIPFFLEEGEEVLVVQYGEGEEGLDSPWQAHPRVRGEKVRDTDPPGAAELQGLVEKHSPRWLVIEYSGTLPLEDLLQVLETPGMARLAYVDKVINVVNARSFDQLLQYLGDTVAEPLAKSSLAVLTHGAGLDRKSLRQLKKRIRGLGRGVELLEVPAREDWEDLNSGAELFFRGSRGLYLTWDNLLAAGLLYIPLLLSVMALWAGRTGVAPAYLARFTAFNTIFISILIQAFPFILAGVIVSGIIHVFVQGEFIERFFSRHRGLSILAALLGGVFFPVCDCAIIPVMRRLVVKGVPLGIAAIFMLASPIVDPVVIASTFYAFPLNPEIALWRIGLGITIALLVGAYFLCFPYRQEVHREGLGAGQPCYCQDCSQCSRQGTGAGGGWGTGEKIGQVIRHTGSEFFEVGQYIIIGAAFSTYLQTHVSPETVELFSGTTTGSLVSMMGLAFLLSICSTSDAFIAMNFSAIFPLAAVISFMVFGAMLDIKNLLLLLGSFRQAFVARLVSVIVLVSLVVLLVFNHAF